MDLWRWVVARKCWRSDIRCLVFYAVVVGMLAGIWVSWWINRPWLEFERLDATYRLTAHQILLQGSYKVNRECDHGGWWGALTRWVFGKAVPPDNVPVWRNQAIATDGQIALYGPIPEAPSLAPGHHTFAMTIPLLAEIYPDGWTVTSFASCPGERPETVVSRLAVVLVLDDMESPP